MFSKFDCCSVDWLRTDCRHRTCIQAVVLPSCNVCGRHPNRMTSS
jgi:hypothetical protein